MTSDSRIKEEVSESFKMLHKTTEEDKVDDLILGFGDGWGDILLIENIRLEPRYRGYGISLLAVDSLMEAVAKASSAWKAEGIVVIDVLSLGSGLEPGRDHGEAQKKLTQHWELLGLRPLVPKRRLKPGKSCNFVGQWNALWLPKPDDDIATVVPHLFAPSTPRKTAAVPLTTLKRERSPEELVGPVDPPANKRKRKRKRSKKVTPDQPGDVNHQ
jgi:hypothetical protein